MKYREFERKMAPFPVFSVSDILKKDPCFDTRRLVEWQKKKYVQKIINKWYMVSEMELTEELLYHMANRIYSPSYVSFETALAWHGLIPEAVFSVISATSRKTQRFHTMQGNFIYRHLKPSLLFGYRIEKAGEISFKMADPEKAILDYLYLHPKLKSFDDFEAWRINTDRLNTKINRDKMEKYLMLYANRALDFRIVSLFKYVENAESG